MKKICLSLLSVCLLMPCFGNDGDWPHFRGVDFDGAEKAQKIDRDKPFGLKIGWKRELGSGYSTISVVGQVGVTMYCDDTSNYVMAFDTASGEQKWRHEIGPIYKGHSGSHDGPTGTPTIHDGLVYALDPHGRMVAISLDSGEKRWGFQLGEGVEARVPHYGFNTVPTIIGDALILMTGDQEGRAFTAFNRKTGKQLWTAGNDTSTYQSPILWEREGSQNILAVTDNYLMELDPREGKVLWQQEHKVLDNENYALPLLLGDDKVLILNRRETAVFQLKWADGKATMEELWRNRAFQNTYALPVLHEGYLYGFKAQFLTCVDPANGEIKWRSRPPGGQGLTLLDGHLLVIGKNGDLVAVEATPDAYREKARIKLFDQESYSAASYAGGSLYLRNLKEMARVDFTADQTLAQAEKKEPELKGAFGAFVKKVQKASNKKAMIDAFMKEQERFPIHEGKSLVHFVYRGEVDDIAVRRGFEDEVPLAHIDGTDFYFHSEELNPAGHWEYNFSVFGESRLDPLNNHVIGEGPRARNELRMPNWSVPEYLAQPSGPRGRLESFEFESKSLGDKRTVQMYLPAGYDGSSDRFPLMVVNNGAQAVELAKMDVSLDNLIGEKVAPVIVAFVPINRPEFGDEGRAGYVQMLTDELIPHLDKTFRTKPERADRGIMGVGRSAAMATYAALKSPATFGKVANQSYVLIGKFGEEIKTLLDGATKPFEAYVEISTNDYKFPGIDAESDSRNLVTQLKAKGFTVKEQHTAGAPSWGSWRGQTGVILEWFAPKQKKGEM